MNFQAIACHKIIKKSTQKRISSRDMSSHHDPLASHGRGGAGNIAPDQNVYVDGEITREGPEGDQGDGAYSTGVSGRKTVLQSDAS